MSSLRYKMRMSLRHSGLLLFRPAIELLFPQHCNCCWRPATTWLCAECEQEMDEACSQPRCPICASPLPALEAPCPRCAGRPGRLVASIARLGTHDGALRELVHRLKYSHRWALAKPLALELRRQVTVETILERADLLVPIPLHWRRRIARGYNQSELLAVELARGTNMKVANLLERTRDTPHQTALRSLNQRARNMRNAFRVRGGAAGIQGSGIVLVDDVFTTGATMRAAARALKSAGAKRVDAIVLAMADPKSRDFTTI